MDAERREKYLAEDSVKAEIFAVVLFSHISLIKNTAKITTRENVVCNKIPKTKGP